MPLAPRCCQGLRVVPDPEVPQAEVFMAKDCASLEAFEERYGDDLFVDKVEEYDRVAKVEPLLRGLKKLQTELWINGRRRDHGFERAALQVWEADKMNPIAYWSFEDCWKVTLVHPESL